MLQDLRKDYKKFKLSKTDLDVCPIKKFEKWFEEAQIANDEEPNACVLSTVNKNYNVSSRVILLKGIENNEFVFYTNYESRKGRDLNEVPNASMVFWWKQSERQVRIEGCVKRIENIRSDQYFYSRPFESQLVALVSKQSTIIEDENFLESKFNELKQQVTPDNIQRPSYWGGYALKPLRFEFWQGGANRMHDRFEFLLADNIWIINRLAP